MCDGRTRAIAVSSSVVPTTNPSAMPFIASLLDSINHEIDVIKHLATCVPKGQHDYRPSEPQRSTLELLQYLTMCASASAKGAVTESWDHHESYVEKSKAVTPDTFAAAMDAQRADLGELLGGLSEDVLAGEATMPWGEKIGMERALLGMALSPLIAYRMQLFLYAKASGNAGIGPSDCWMGKAAEPKPADAASS